MTNIRELTEKELDAVAAAEGAKVQVTIKDFTITKTVDKSNPGLFAVTHGFQGQSVHAATTVTP